MAELTLGSLFDGSGGFPLGGMLCGIRPVWASEVEPFAIRVTTKRLPEMKHLGDISRIRGGEVEPVDIVTFGSPCTNLSIAGKREGLAGQQSGLFYQAVRIIKEMREATNGRYPRYCVWENVAGAFSSNKGQDFKAVLEAIIGIVRTGTEVPAPQDGRWPYADCYMGDGWSVAYRTLDAQYWGVPQRRKRIYLVADLDGGTAGKVLFESEGVSGYSAAGFRAWQRAARGAAPCAGTTGQLCLNDQGGQRMDVSVDVTGTLRAQMDSHPPVILDSYPIQPLTSPTETCVPLLLKIRSGCAGGGKGALIQDNMSATLSTNNDQTLFEPKCFGICSKQSHSMLSDNPRAGFYEASTSRTLDRGGGDPTCNQGGIAVVEGEPVEADVYAMTTGSYSQVVRNQSPTLMSRDYKDPPVVSEVQYSVRRLTPTECARLQGFPDWWCADLGTEDPTAVELTFWREVFETHRKIVGTSSKPKTDKQILKWLKDPHSDAAEYKLWGNGVALPCVFFVLAGIVWAEKSGSAD